MLAYDEIEVILMLIKDVCKECKLTKKAVEYYEEQGLIHPKLLDNGYREFREEDIIKLKKISVLRKLGLSIENICNILNNPENDILKDIAYQKDLEVEQAKSKQQMLERLAQGITFEELTPEIELLDQKETIIQKLLITFPGYYGRFLGIHFGRFLNEPIKTKEQQEAYDTIVAFLDKLPSITFPEELKDYMIEATGDLGSEDIRTISTGLEEAVLDFEQFIQNHSSSLKQYMMYRNSDEFKNSPAHKLQLLLKEFNQNSGYYDVFIPAMKKLSISYQEYTQKLEEANKVFMNHYPNVNL